MPAFWRMSLPVPVTLTACPYPSGSSSSAWCRSPSLVRLLLVGSGLTCAGRCCQSSMSGSMFSDLRRPLRSCALGRCSAVSIRSACSRPRDLRSRSAARRSRSAVGFRLGLGLLLVRAEHHDHVAAVLLRRGLDEPELLDVAGKPLQQPEPELGSVLLATTEHDRDLDLVALLEEAHDVTLLGLVVVRVDLRAKLHFFDDRVGLVAPRLACLLGVLVLELAVVHELADRRTCRRCHLDQVEICLLRPDAAHRRCGRCRPARRWGRPAAPQGRGYGR